MMFFLVVPKMVSMVFECDRCGKRKVINDPIVIEIPHRGCGGTFRALSIAKVRKPKPKIIPSPNYDEDTLMGFILKKYGHIPKETLRRYKVVQCRHCGNIQVTTAEEEFKCLACNRTMKFRVQGRWHVKLKDFDNLAEAIRCCQLWKLKEGKNEGKNHRIFGD